MSAKQLLPLFSTSSSSSVTPQKSQRFFFLSSHKQIFCSEKYFVRSRVSTRANATNCYISPGSSLSFSSSSFSSLSLQCVCGKNWVTFPVGISQFAFLWCLAVSHCPVFPKSCSQDQSLLSRLDLSASWPSWNFLRRGFGCHELEMMEEMSPQYWGATLREPTREAGCHTMLTYVLGAPWAGLWSGAPSMVLAVSLGSQLLQSRSCPTTTTPQTPCRTFAGAGG